MARSRDRETAGATFAAQAEQARTFENHPIFHDWYVHGDVILARRRGTRRPTLIQRRERCNNCPTEKLTKIDVALWVRVGNPRYIYDRTAVIVRVTKAAYLKQRFLETTDLPPEEREALAA